MSAVSVPEKFSRSDGKCAGHCSHTIRRLLQELVLMEGQAGDLGHVFAGPGPGQALLLAFDQLPLALKAGLAEGG